MNLQNSCKMHVTYSCRFTRLHFNLLLDDTGKKSVSSLLLKFYEDKAFHCFEK